MQLNAAFPVTEHHNPQSVPTHIRKDDIQSYPVCNEKLEVIRLDAHKEKYFEIIPEGISAYNIGPFDINGDDTKTNFQNKDNWAQGDAGASAHGPSSLSNLTKILIWNEQVGYRDK
jgi:hypothetical protein